MKNDRDNPFSDEFLNAFVDGQLTSEEKAEAYERINRDHSVNRKVCELRKLRDLVQLAYAAPPPPPVHKAGPRSRRRTPLNIAAGLVAGFALLLGAVFGWHLSGGDAVPPAVSQSGAAPGPGAAARPGSAQLASARQEQKVLFHLNSGDPENMKEALDEVENLLKFYRKTGQRARVELVMNGGGLKLVRQDASPYPERVRRMQKEYNNLTFIACQNSIDRLKDERGITARLVPGTVVIDSGVAQIMRRQQQGWAYIQV